MKTTLYGQHQKRHAQFVHFGGWEMPLQYQGIIEEHHAIRERVGIFDVSHMGRISIIGPEAEYFLDQLAANLISGKTDGSVTYTVLCSDKGTAVDDTLIYRIDDEHYFMIANASNRLKDLAHLQQYKEAFEADVSIIPHFDQEGILAIQGPFAVPLMLEIIPESALLNKPMHLIHASFKGVPFLLSTTGYTGAEGYEIYAPLSLVSELWDIFLNKGAVYGILPVGLGARNTLRLEMGYALYGHELSDTIYPTESVASWSVKLSKPNFLGQGPLLELENSPHKRFSGAIRLLEPGIIRDNYTVFDQNKEVGIVTSGGYSPSLNQSIGLILTNRPYAPGERIQVQIRKQFVSAEVTYLPFIRSQKQLQKEMK